MGKWHIISDERLDEIVRRRTDDAKYEIQKKYELENLAGIISLQTQINSHFWYNTLECIRGQAVIDGADLIADILEIFANFFRYQISSKSNVSTLQEELDSVNAYMQIMQYRFPNRFDLDITCLHGADFLSKCLLPKLSLQPIVENCIEHGFANMQHSAKVTVDVNQMEQLVSITISDNGMGMDAKTLKTLRYQISHSFDREAYTNVAQRYKGNGVALPNVNKRIQLLYGKEYGISILSEEGTGTSVEIILPYRTKIGG